MWKKKKVFPLEKHADWGNWPTRAYDPTTEVSSLAQDTAGLVDTLEKIGMVSCLSGDKNLLRKAVFIEDWDSEETQR